MADFLGLMKQATQLQAKMQEMQAARQAGDQAKMQELMQAMRAAIAAGRFSVWAAETKRQLGAR